MNSPRDSMKSPLDLSKLAGTITGPSLQRGAGQGWMLLTIGVIVGFVLGFVLFLSGMPEENYTLVETERAVESYQEADPSQFGFYDKLPGVQDAVPNVKAEQLPAFDRTDRTGRFGAGTDERPTAVKIADEFNLTDDVRPIEIATAAAPGGLTAGATLSASNVRAAEAGALEVQEPTIIKKVPNAPKTFYYLQAGAFSSNSDAAAMQSSLRNSGMDAFIHKVRKDGKLLHRVRIGPFYDSINLRDAQQRLSQSGLGYLVIKVQS